MLAYTLAYTLSYITYENGSTDNRMWQFLACTDLMHLFCFAAICQELRSVELT